MYGMVDKILSSRVRHKIMSGGINLCATRAWFETYQLACHVCVFRVSSIDKILVLLRHLHIFKNALKFNEKYNIYITENLSRKFYVFSLFLVNIKSNNEALVAFSLNCLLRVHAPMDTKALSL